jgi:hypothetical protein
MGFGLINSVFIWGFLAISIPIIIHLFFKRQYKHIQWAAIQFLLEAEKRIRKKIKLIELLMLLLRCTVIFLLVILFGKIFLDKTGVFNRPFGGKAIFYHLVLDDSPSMNFIEKDSTPFKKSIQSIKSLAKRLSEKNEEAFFSLYVTSNLKKPIFNKILLNQDAFLKLETYLNSVSTFDIPLSPEICLSEIQKIINPKIEPYHHMLRFYSDYRDSDWSVLNLEQLKSKLESSLGVFESVSFVDSSLGQNNNLAITNVNFSEKKLIKNVPLKFYIEVSNFSNITQKNVDVTMIPPNGMKIKSTIQEIRPNNKEIVAFSYTFSQAGTFDMKWTINEDNLSEDNIKNMSLDIVLGSRILLVDGDAESTSNQFETKFLQTALMPPGDTFSGNQVERKTDSEFEISSIDDYDIIYICNVYRILPQNIQQLSAWVARGGSLVFSLGDQVDASYYNEFLYNSGKGLFPCKLDKIKILNLDERAQFSDINFSHPIFKSFSNDSSKFIFKANFFGWWLIDKDTIAKSKILASFNDVDKSPAFIEKQYEKGKIFLFTSSLDDDWNSWPSEFSYLITQLELVKYCLKDETMSNQFIAGEKIKLNLNSNRYKNKILYVNPVTQTQSLIHPNIKSSEEFEFNYADTFKAGFYHFELLSAKDVKEEKSFSVNIKPEEGISEKGAFPLTLRKLSIPRIYYVDISKDSNEDETSLKNEFWKTIIFALIGVMLIETIAGWYFGGKR